ncbi:MAG: hypothetical protein F7B59_05850 [Desulfurococcales archaeon]|nr:hypothetical protein [Desulfurococcales archaeon]
MIGVFREQDELGRRLIVILRGFPCSYGKCTFCPFAIEQSLHTSKVIFDNREIINNAVREKEEYRPDRIAVFNGGSFHELPYDTVERLKPLAKNTVFEVEERSEFITLESIRNLLDYYKPEHLVIRVGFETFREDIREKTLNKGMPDSELKRVIQVRIEAQSRGWPVSIWSYLLFGMKGISEESVAESLRAFKKVFDGVIAVRYKKYLPNHPEPVPVSKELRELLNREADLVDWGGEQWMIGEKKGYAPE